MHACMCLHARVCVCVCVCVYAYVQHVSILSVLWEPFISAAGEDGIDPMVSSVSSAKQDKI